MSTNKAENEGTQARDGAGCSPSLLSLDFIFLIVGSFPSLMPPTRELWGLLTSTLLSLHSCSPCWHVNSHLPLMFCS